MKRQIGFEYEEEEIETGGKHRRDDEVEMTNELTYGAMRKNRKKRREYKREKRKKKAKKESQMRKKERKKRAEEEKSEYVKQWKQNGKTRNWRRAPVPIRNDQSKEVHARNRDRVGVPSRNMQHFILGDSPVLFTMTKITFTLLLCPPPILAANDVASPPILQDIKTHDIPGG
ncbi:uncharacterized protein EV420DRAFT_1748280 [Desarmillaria tabescens]|uniref:Uncharacterized protein n=1 Tax=Armillaria tabescens TaxID=1929756 RepID=A0AA39N590_ARMTA|nr:uncharacterized protein EV420DRAFT_1748280 [Desarmillaria tabescens]KAK0457923.1 hypothetical protein EV420DRAFT_1748280 [Desarmillaria tabescens]